MMRFGRFVLAALFSASPAIAQSSSSPISGVGYDNGAVRKANNLSDVSATTARTNLGLGTASTQNTGTSGANVCLANAPCTYSSGLTVTGANISTTRQLALSRTTLSLSNGLNSNISTTAGFNPLSGPTASFSVGGFTGGTDGNLLVIHNTTTQQMTIVNEDASSTAANRIATLTGANVVLRAGTSAATFIYSGLGTRWVLIATN